MNKIRQSIGGLGNLLFKQAFIIGQVLDGNIPDVYVQDYHHWEKHADAIRKIFGDGIGRTEKVAVHVRRGDYLKASDFHLDLFTTDYYQKAVKEFPDAKFLVFCRDRQDSDLDYSDRKWCEIYLPAILGDFEFAPTTLDDTDDLNLMASCTGHIMANSTFSWWAAFLNPNKDKKIVCPNRWFTDSRQRVALPPEWKQL